MVDRRDQLARASAVRGRWDPDRGLLLIWVGVAIIVIPCVAVIVLWYTHVFRSDTANAAVPLLLVVTVVLVTRGRRMRARSAERALAEDVRAPIVYLRPFDADGARIAVAWSSHVRMSVWDQYGITYEERLARILRKIGPFVAVGNPTEELPVLGAARVYATDEAWQMTVDELTARAGVVLLQAGESEGVAWEVHHVVNLDAPERLILSLPLATRRRPSRAERYAAFRSRFGDLFPRPLPESIGDCQFAYFDADWTPRLLGERGVSLPAGEDPRTLAVRRLAREFKIRWAPRWARASAIVIGVLVVGYAVASLTGVTASIDRVDDCRTAGVPLLKALKPPFATSDSAMKRYTRDDCQALEDAHLLADGGKLASAAAIRMRCERYTAALYDYEPADRRGPHSRWDEVAARYCAAPTAPDPRGVRLLQTAGEVNGP